MKQTYIANPNTTTIISLYLKSGAPGTDLCSLFFMEILSRIAQARKEPNKIVSARVPFEIRWQKAQIFVAVNNGCLSLVFIFPGKLAAKNNGNTGSIRIMEK